VVCVVCGGGEWCVVVVVVVVCGVVVCVCVQESGMVVNGSGRTGRGEMVSHSSGILSS
jgi:hypothetical protein